MNTASRTRCTLGLLTLGLLTACGASDARDSEAGGDAEGCPSDDVVERYLEDWRERRPTQALATEGSLENALCAQDKIVERLRPTLGEPVGYKAGLTSAATQELFGVDEPVRGVLLEGMLLEDGARVSPDFGARPQYEADLIVVVGDAGINDAESPEEVLEHLSHVVPFIELPDLAVAEDEPLNGSSLTAINVASRLGVLGRPVPVEATPEYVQALADMSVRVRDQEGAELASARGSAVLGHPLNSVLWLVESGVRFVEGDYVSVGSIGPLLPPEPGLTASVTYEGLPGDPTVTVNFE